MTVQTIKVEKLEPHTFNSWTDGPKIVVDVSHDFPHPVCPVEYYEADLEQARVIIRTNPVATVYVVSNLHDFLSVQQHFPDRDVRLLLV